VAITNGRQATEIAMDQFTQIIKDNGFRKSPQSKIDWTNMRNMGIISTMNASTAGTQVKVPINVLVNAHQLDQANTTTGILVGSMFHAWLHRAGFIDPKVTSYFISECPMCVMRGYQAKNPTLSDTLFYRYFD
jgi:hypothetical protein